jgi:hypothetical protein
MKCRLGLILVLLEKDSHDYLIVIRRPIWVGRASLFYLQNVADDTSQVVYSERALLADFCAPTHHLRFDNFPTVLITHLKLTCLRKSQFLKLHQHSSCLPSLPPEWLLPHIIKLSAAIERVQPPPSHKGMTSVFSSSSKEISQGYHKTKKKTGFDFAVLTHVVYARRIEYRLLRERSWHHKIQRIAVLGNDEIIWRR